MLNTAIIYVGVTQMKFNKNQLAAIQHREGPCCVIAGAGSGKTAVLINRIAALISSGVDSQAILAVTFSKKAFHRSGIGIIAVIYQDRVRKLDDILPRLLYPQM